MMHAQDGRVMHWQGSCEVAAVPRHDVIALFARRPARWFHTFLVLAANHAAPSPQGGLPRNGTERHWYRLGQPDDEGCARLVWHPVPRAGLFDGFTGHVHLDPCTQGEGTTVRLVGEVTGGQRPVNDVALRSLLDLLASAFDGITLSDS